MSSPPHIASAKRNLNTYTSSVSIVFTRFLKEGLDLALKGIFVHHAGVQVGDFAGAIDEQGYRHSFVHAELLC